MANVTLTGNLVDITSNPIDSTTKVFVKAPSYRPGGALELVTSQPSPVSPSSTGEITLTVNEGLGYLYIEGNGWSDTMRFVAKAGMSYLVEAVLNAGEFAMPGPIGDMALADIQDALDNALANIVDTTDTTHIAGWVNDDQANKVLRLNGDGKLYIADDAVVAGSDPVNKNYVDRSLRITNLAPRVGNAGWSRYGASISVEGNPATITHTGQYPASQIYTLGAGTGALPVTPGEYLNVAYTITDSVSVVYTTLVFYDGTGEEIRTGYSVTPFVHNIAPNKPTRVSRTTRVPGNAKTVQVRIGYNNNRVTGSTYTISNVMITCQSFVTTGEYVEKLSTTSLTQVVPQVSPMSPLVASPAALRTWFARLAERFERSINVYVIGDSISEGASSSDLKRRWVNVLQRSLRDLFGVPQGAEYPFIPAKYGYPVPGDIAPVITGNVSDISMRGPGWRSVQLADTTCSVEFTYTGTSSALAASTTGSTVVDVTENGTTTRHTLTLTPRDPAYPVPSSVSGEATRKVKVTYVSGDPLRLDGLYTWNYDEKSGIRVIDASHAGYGYGTLGYSDIPDVGDCIYRAKPDLIISALMSNDIIANNPSRVSGIINDFFKNYTANAPGVPVVMFSMYKRAEHDEEGHDSFRRLVADKVAENRGVYFIDFRRFMPDMVLPIEDPRNLSMTSDGVHPTDLGHKRMAEVVSTILSNPGQVTT